MKPILVASILGLISITGYASDKPNILILFPDDVGWQNVSAYGHGTMGYRTPNIDRIAKEGALFTDHYAQPSCTAGRAALITGQYPIRSGMTTVGRPGAELGLKPQSHTLAEVLKELGYATGQFGKNHLGDRNEHLPTVHGFDEFFGNLYHLNTQEEFEQVDYPKDPEYFKKFGTRGVLHSWATDEENTTIDPRFGMVGKQTIEDTGQLSRERMKTMDEEFIKASLDFIERAQAAEQPFFVWFNPCRMHMYTRLSDESRYLAAEHTTEHDFYGSGLMEHDKQIGELLDALEEMGVLDNTIVIYSTDNGPEHSARLHGGTTPFRGEKMTTYEGGVRVPLMIRWPDKIAPGTVLSGIQTHMDIYTTLAAAAGEPDIANKVLREQEQFIDGINNLDYWTGQATKSKRDHFFYYYESSIKAVRYKQWKLHFETSENYYAPYEKQKFPVMYNLRMDPFESFDGTTDRSDIIQSKQWLNEPIQHLLSEHIQSLAKYPPVQKAASFDFSALIEQLMQGKQ
ncbi:arylsulfatase [Coraliomargarita akajimensis]|uniref:Sulfatase n=1 Tax=Coraliomargarita akajimensis (strain DSM 45221 / IAM 15411 / JCM 23193 / KCTC 12865 / 04OKA010-24) TaxID=583355 RepID=D5ELV9_CORAD|nr:arylsulfatase [Coraliomargarita akajimensis]ADE53284.1 sulfatase [Coraliomargarita akajimensis DSM 45221]